VRVPSLLSQERVAHELDHAAEARLEPNVWCSRQKRLNRADRPHCSQTQQQTQQTRVSW